MPDNLETSVPKIVLTEDEMLEIRDGRINDDTTSFIYEPKDILRGVQPVVDNSQKGHS